MRVLREENDLLKHENEVLRQQKEEIALTARKAFESYLAMSEEMKKMHSILKASGMLDPKRK